MAKLATSVLVGLSGLFIIILHCRTNAVLSYNYSEPSNVFHASAISNKISSCPQEAFSEIRRRYACTQASFLTSMNSRSSMSLLDAAVSHSRWQAGVTRGITAVDLLRLANPRLLFKVPHSTGLLLEPLELLFDLTWSCGGREQPADWWRLVLTTFCRQQTSGRFLPYGQTLPNLAAAFVVYACSKTRGNLHICPNACRSEPCKSLAHTISTDCVKVEAGLFTDQFRCNCQFGFRWDDATRKCIEHVFVQIDLSQKRQVSKASSFEFDMCKSKPCANISHAVADSCLSTMNETFACKCKDKFWWTELNSSCIPDYCSEQPCNLSVNAIADSCSMTPSGGHGCQCIEDHVWNDALKICEIDACSQQPCHSIANARECVQMHNEGFACLCHQDYKWLPVDRVCALDLCVSKPCDSIINTVSGRCVTVGIRDHDFLCECIDGFFWSSSQKSCDLDPCRFQPCKKIGAAMSNGCQRYGLTDFSCTCAEGHAWHALHHACYPNPCVTNPCQRFAQALSHTCHQVSIVSPVFTCRCDDGYIWNKSGCEKMDQDLLLGPCQFDYCHFIDNTVVGSCQNIGVADFMCDCMLPRVWDPVGHRCHSVSASVAAQNLMFDNCLMCSPACCSIFRLLYLLLLTLIIILLITFVLPFGF